MRLILETPVKLRILDPSEEELAKLSKILSYKDKNIQFQIKNMSKSSFYITRYGEEWFKSKIHELEQQVNKSLLLTDQKGFWTYSGLKDKLIKTFDCSFENHVEYPEFKLIPWNKEPPYKPYPYQEQAVTSLLANSHANANAATGLGKSFIISLLVKKTGLNTVISTPSTNIAKQIYKECTNLFGKKFVGFYGAGKKEVGKRILVAIGKSLSLVDNPEEIAEFKKYQVFISDENHFNAASTFDNYINKLLGHCPYRWFLSATPERNDGKDLLLQGIIGKEVFNMTIQEGIEQGYLAKLSTLIFDIKSKSDYSNSNNIVKMNQKHLYENEDIAIKIAQISNYALNNNLPILILVDEHNQEKLLQKYMKISYAYASGKADTSKICQDFNDGKIDCVVGTSAVATGTNFLRVQLTINWQGSKARTKTFQGPIGRSTRLHKESGKTECKIIDFRITNIPTLTRHSNFRIQYYQEVGPVEFTKIT